MSNNVSRLNDDKKKILVYTSFFFPWANANTNVLMPIIDYLSKYYTVDIVTEKHSKNDPSNDVYKGYKVYRYKAKEYFIYKLLRLTEKDPNSVVSSFAHIKRFILRILHIRFFSELIRRIAANTAYAPRNDCVEVKKLLITGNYSAILSLSAPIEPQYAVLILAQHGILEKYNVKWFPFFSDPHATFIGTPFNQRDKLLKLEYDIYKYADLVFTTPELYQDNKYYILNDFIDKTVPIALANIRCPQSSIQPIIFDSKKINCVYVGSFFNVAVRNPEYFFKVISSCSPNIEVHIICYAEDIPTKKLREQYLSGRKNIKWHQRMSLQECLSIMQEADILINVGNKCTNQTPSKIFDYISTGKPIVNFYSIEDDTSKRYLELYPTKCNILETEELRTSDVETFNCFCFENAKTIIPFDQIKTLYQGIDSETSCKKFYLAIKHMLDS